MEILIVDDQEQVCEMLEQALRIAGYGSMSALSAEEALDLFEKRKEEIGLAIVDLVLPEMDGISLCKNLKSLKPQLKVVLFSGHSDEFLMKKLVKQAGADGHFTKPFVVKQAVNLVRNLL